MNTVGSSDNELISLFLDTGAVFFVVVTIIGIEESLVDQDTEFFLIGEGFYFTDEDKETGGSGN